MGQQPLTLKEKQLWQKKGAIIHISAPYVLIPTPQWKTNKTTDFCLDKGDILGSSQLNVSILYPSVLLLDSGVTGFANN